MPVIEPLSSAGNFELYIYRKRTAADGQRQFQATSIWTAIGTSVGATIAITIAFSLLRPYNSVVYAPKLKYADQKHAPPTIGKGIFAWFMPVLKIHEAEMVEKIGLDGTVFLRFTKMCRDMFIVVMIVAVGIILPTNVITNDKSDEAPVHGPLGFWTATTPQYTKGAGLWVHIVCMYLVNGIVGFFLWWNYRKVTQLRRAYFESTDYLQSLHSRTIMVTDIPPASRTDEGILRLADEVEQTSGLPRAAIARNVKELPELIEAHEKAVRGLESVLAKYLKIPEKLPTTRPMLRPSKNYRKNHGVTGEKVDAIDYLTDRISELEMEIKHVRESIDKRNPMPYGFASFEKIEDAHVVAYAAKNKHPQGATIELAPRPHDLIWKNLPLTKRERSWKGLINNFWIAVLTVVWIAPNALIAIFLSNLANLANLWPGFKTNFEGHHTEWAIVQGIASPALTSLVYLILPIIFRRLSIHAGNKTKAARERNVTTKLYAFFVFNNLIVFSVFAALFTFVTTVIDSTKNYGDSAWEAIEKGYFFDQILWGLIHVSPFWLSWLIQRNLGSAADISQIWNLLWTGFMRRFMSPTPRQSIEWSAPPVMDYAVYYNYFLFYSTVALCFVTIQPLVVPVTVFFFVIDYWLKKYLLLYVLITKNESGGVFWRMLFNRMIFAMILANCIIALTLKANGTWVMVGVMGPLPLLALGFKIYCARTFDDRNDFYTKALLGDPENLKLGANGKKPKRISDRVASKFGHPALYAKLMTPMVHAKAQSVLKDIYHGRMQDDSAFSSEEPTDYSNIAMDPMSQQYPGKSARFAPDRSLTQRKREKDMFEVVPESRLDFGYFKDRADFRDEYGGDGDIYGRPTDLISERSGTPHSFMGHHSRGGSGSPSSSRASRPSGGYRSYSPHGLQNVHPALRNGSFGSQGGAVGGDGGGFGPGPGRAGFGMARGHMYSNSNESERNLLTGAQPVGRETPPEDEEMMRGRGREMYGLDRWRTGGTGYASVPGQEIDQGTTGYEAYRGGGI